MITPQLNKTGRIIAGNDKDYYIRIICDKENTGGYIILTSSSLDISSGFDNWVETEETLQKYIEESKWEIDWTVE
ncbi:hypothetical protein [Pseudomonas sp. xss_2]|uniref:hypothetical protein n=1 Tax=Pseudomonas sp. xss_2 TaxID=3367215 RepID=UPI00370CAEDB